MDPYLYPGTNVLRNLRDIRDPERLAEFEANATGERITQLEEKPVIGSFDSGQLQNLHHYIFQDVYGWAWGVSYRQYWEVWRPLKEHIVSSLNKTFAELTEERDLSGADLKRFCNRGAYYLGEVNAIHPFREGNGRTQRELMRQLALRHGLIIEWSRVSREQMIDASQAEFSPRLRGTRATA